MSCSCVPCSTIRPFSTRRIQSALRMVDSRCAMTTEVRPRITVSIAAWIFCSVMVSTDAVASSRIRMRGSARIARATGKAQQLLFPGGKQVAALPDFGIQAVFQAPDQFFG